MLECQRGPLDPQAWIKDLLPNLGTLIKKITIKFEEIIFWSLYIDLKFNFWKYRTREREKVIQ